MNILKKYIRNNKGKPVGMVVATANGVGWSKCKKGDRWDRHLGEKIAIARAEMSLQYSGKVPSSMTYDIVAMDNRRKNYFK